MRYQILHSACEVPLEMTSTDLDLPQWLFRLSDKEYQACSKGHLVAGTSILPDGTQTSVNVESVGGHLMIQHYIPEIALPEHLKLVSQSDCWLFHLWYVRLKVTWDIKLLPTSDTTCLFQNTVVVEHDSVIMKVLTALVLGSVFLKKHNAEETPRFALNLVEETTRKLQSGAASRS
jgi:hypothetical protein